MPARYPGVDDGNGHGTTEIGGSQIPRKVGTHLRDVVRLEDKSIVVIDTADGPLEVRGPDHASRTKWLFEGG